MSDTRSNQEPSLKGAKGQGIEPSRQEIDAVGATSSSDDHQQLEFHDSKHWHAACLVRDCRLGFPECKVGSSCSKPGRKNLLEESLHRSRSSVGMLPSLLSNLAVPVSRIRSDPCIFGKDFLRITLPLPGEPSGCGAQGQSVDQSESSAFENMVLCETSNFNLVANPKDNPMLEASTSSKKNIAKTGVSSGNDSLFFVQTSVTLMQGGDESIHNIAWPRTDDSKEHRVLASDMARLNEDRISQDFGVIFPDKAPAEIIGEWSIRDFDDTPRKPQWDDWWSCQSNERIERSKHSAQTMTQYCRNKSKKTYLTSTEVMEIDQAEEEGSDEGYLVYEKQEDQQFGRFEDEGDSYDDDDEEEEESIYPNQFGDGAGEVLPKEGEMGSGKCSKGCEEDDIWSDEDFVSSQVKGFPPPISILANETHPGLPGHMPRTLWRSVKRDGRFVLQEVQAQPREFFRATREFGRLRLQLIRPDSDPVGNNAEALDLYNEDSAEAVSIACSNNLGNLAEVSDTNKAKDCGIVHEGDLSGTLTEGIVSLQPVGCWEAEKGSKSETVLDHDGLKFVGGLMPPLSLLKECGCNVPEGQTPSACSGQTCTEMFGLIPSSNEGHKEVPGLTGGGVMIDVSCVTNVCHISEKLWGGKIALDETLGESTFYIITHESRSPDSGQREVAKVSKIDNREEVVGCCPSDDDHVVLAVGIPLDQGYKPIVGQIDREKKVERIGVTDLCTKLDVGQVDEVEGLGISNHCNVVLPTSVDGREEQFRQDFQHPCFNTTYGFDNNLNVLSPSQTFMQFPIQPAVR